MCYTTVYRGINSLTLSYTTLDSCITYTYTAVLYGQAVVTSPSTAVSSRRCTCAAIRSTDAAAVCRVPATPSHLPPPPSVPLADTTTSDVILRTRLPRWRCIHGERSYGISSSRSGGGSGGSYSLHAYLLSWRREKTVAQKLVSLGHVTVEFPRPTSAYTRPPTLICDRPLI